MAHFKFGPRNKYPHVSPYWQATAATRLHATLAVCQCGDDSTQSYSAPYLLQSRRGLGHDQCSSRSVCMHGVSVRAVRVRSGHGATYFPTYKAAACHYARSRACNQSNRGIRLVTIQSKPSDSLTGMLAALVPPGLGHQPVPTRRAQVCHIYQSGYIPP